MAEGKNQFELAEEREDWMVFGSYPEVLNARTNNEKTKILNENVSSYLLKEGDIIGVREKSKSLEVIETSLSSGRYNKYAWLEWDQDQKAGKFVNVPERS